MPNFSDTQALLFSGFPHLAAAVYLLVKICDGAAFKSRFRQWQQSVTFYDDRKATECFNLAFTHSGLRAMGLSEAELKTFAVPFCEGMAASHRSQLLGDFGDNAPENWNWGKSDQVDLVVIFLGVNDSSLRARTEEWMQSFCMTGVCSLVTDPVRSHPNPKNPDGASPHEHFGFRDGMSQPVIRDLLDKKSPAITEEFRRYDGRYFDHNIVPAGEFLFGYPNCYQLIPSPPLVTPKRGSPLRLFGESKHTPSDDIPQLDFGCDGTYIVLRQIRQYVGEFWRRLGEASRDAKGNVDLTARELLAAKIVGRWQNGAPLAKYPNAEPHEAPEGINDFLFREGDEHGERCPIGAHVRRANPRDSLDMQETSPRALELVNRHRILRRGRPYGPWLENRDEDDDQERGLMFVALNVNLERQFEFIQNAWVNNHKFAGLYSESDPLLGSLTRGAQGRMFTIQAQPVRRRIQTLGQFVRVVGGGYFFLPSRPAIAHLLL